MPGPDADVVTPGGTFDPRVSVRGHGCSLFMPEIDRANTEIFRVVNDLVVRPTHQVEKAIGPLFLEGAGDQITSVNFGHGFKVISLIQSQMLSCLANKNRRRPLNDRASNAKSASPLSASHQSRGMLRGIATDHCGEVRYRPASPP